MTSEERDAFLSEQRTCRIATIGLSGRPHVSPLWYYWDGRSLWVYSLVRSTRWQDLERNPQTAVVVDAGDQYQELRGVELVGVADFVGEVPRTGAQAIPELCHIERGYALKYTERGTWKHTGRHGWIRITPSREFTWDFRKLHSVAE